MTETHLPAGVLEELRQLTTCLAASAIETFGVRLPNAGFCDAGIRAIFPEMPAVVGYAATALVRSAAPPMEGGTYYARTDWWEHILSVGAPRIVVLQDVDEKPGLGALVGEVHASILHSLGCEGLVTNGAVRDLPQVRAIPFPMFAGNVSVSHAYAHISGFGHTVEMCGLKIRPGDLLMADMHGVLTIPVEIAARVPDVAREIRARRRTLVDLCRGGSCDRETLRETCTKLGVIRHAANQARESDSKGGRS